MNKIKELAIEAGLISEEYNGFDRTELSVVQYKFAQLIINECIKRVGPDDSYQDEWFKVKVDAVVKIKDHFGIE
jgi:hypothetical protein